MNFYQLWLDDLFPRAKFADGLAIIEKLGHSRRLQTMRRQWIEEEKRGRRFEDDDTGPAQVGSMNDQPLDVAAGGNDGGIVDGERGQHPEEGRPSMNIGLDRSISRQQTQGDDGHGLFLSDDEVPNEVMEQNGPGEDVPEHDELDDLLREQEDAAVNIT